MTERCSGLTLPANRMARAVLRFVVQVLQVVLILLLVVVPVPVTFSWMKAPQRGARDHPAEVARRR